MKKGLWLALSAVLLTAAVIVLPIINSGLMQSKRSPLQEVKKSDKNIVERSENEIPSKTGSEPKSKDENVTFLVVLKERALIERFAAPEIRADDLRDYILSDAGRDACDAVKKSQAVAKASIKKLVPASDLEKSMTFSAVINGLTVNAPLSSMQKLQSINGVASVSVLYDDMFFMDNDTGEEISQESSIEEGTEESAQESTEESSEESGGTSEDESSDDTDPETAAAAANLSRFIEVYDSLMGFDSELPYSGEEMLIAVIDSEFDVDDGVFAGLPEKTAISRETISNLYKNIRFNAAADKGGSAVYVSPKIVFAYDYAEDDSSTSDEALFHGTAAAAVAAGKSGEDEKLKYHGVAPEAQLALMKTSSQRRSDGKIAVKTDAFIAAVDDAAKLGADVINISLGSYDGIRNIGTFRTIFDNLSKAGIIVSGAAGNGGYNGCELGRMPSTSDIFYSAENKLFDDSGVLTAGSVNVPIKFRRYITIGGSKIYYSSLNENKLSKIIRYTELKEEPEESSEASDGESETAEISQEMSAEQSIEQSEESAEQDISTDAEVTGSPEDGDVSEISEMPEDPETSEISEPEPEKEPQTVQNNRYIYVDSYSSNTGFGDKELTDKALIINASQTDDIEKAFEQAMIRGVTSIIIVNGGMTDAVKTAKSVPVVALDGDVSGFLLKRPENDTFEITLSGDPVEGTSQKEVSAFTSYCASDSQGIGARLAAPGENILAVPSRGEDAFISGTSSAAPCISGSAALIRQYLGEVLPSGIRGRRSADITQAIMLSSCQPVRMETGSKGSAVYYSPRQQGFGLINIRGAVTSGAYLTTSGDTLKALSLGDGETGEYELHFTVTNLSAEERTYKPSFAVQTDNDTYDSTGKSFNTMKPRSLTGDSLVKWMSAEGNEIKSFKLEAGESAELTAVLTIKDTTLSALKERYSEGFWIDGYLFVTDQHSSVLSLPFSGFYGSMEGTDPFDNTIYDTEKSVTGLTSSYKAVAFKNGGYSFADLSFSGDRLLFSKDSVRCMEDDSAYSSAVILPDLYTLRTVYDMTVKIYDSGGKQLYSENLGTYSSYRHKDAHPFEQLADRTRGLREAFAKLSAGRYRYEISACTKNADGTLSEPVKTSADFELDSKPPRELSSLTRTELGRIILELTANDENGICGFELYATAYDSKNDKYDYIDSIDDMISAGYISADVCTLIDQTDNDDGSYIFRYDITDLQRELRKLSVNTTTWQNKVSDMKIAYKAIDCSGNASGVKTADVIEYGSAEFVFTDQNGRPAKGITVTIDNTAKTSDKNGSVIFSRLEPDYYNAVVTADKNEYDLSVGSYIVSIYRDKLHYKAEQTVSFKGEYSEESEEGSGGEAVSDKQAPVHDIDEDKDDPVLALAFVGIMLLFSAAIFVIRKNYNKS